MREILHSAGTGMKGRKTLYTAANVLAAALLLVFLVYLSSSEATPVYASEAARPAPGIRTEKTDAAADESACFYAKSFSAKSFSAKSFSAKSFSVNSYSAAGFSVNSISAKSFSATILRSFNVKLSCTSYKYDGRPKCPSVTVKDGGKKLKKNRDYTVSYRDNKRRGTAKVIVRGKGIYTGKVTKTFKIK